MLYKDGYSYDNWADTVEVTATFTDGSVQRKTIYITYTAEGVQVMIDKCPCSSGTVSVHP